MTTANCAVLLNTKVNIETANQEELIAAFEQRITAICMIRAEKANLDPESDVVKHQISAIIDWLRSTDFYTAPASTRFHDSEPIGLLRHSLNVYNQALDIKNLPKFSKVSLDSIALVSLCHDLCKIGLYSSYMRNVKNEETGVWEKVPSYKREKPMYPIGHGQASVYILSRFIKLSFEEMLAIRWHMGAWYVCDSEMDDLQKSNEDYPLGHLLQFADQLSIVNY